MPPSPPVNTAPSGRSNGAEGAGWGAEIAARDLYRNGEGAGVEALCLSNPGGVIILLDSARSPAIVLSREVEATMSLSQLTRVAPVVFGIITFVAAHGQQGRWAAADNATAKFMVDAERQWAEAACTHNKITEKILADDFQGMSPEGKRYTKSEEVADTADLSKTARDCRLIDAKVRFFGDDLAMVYGSESSVRKPKDGTEKSRCLIWTDTWLKRNGTWQIVAAQDTQFDCK